MRLSPECLITRPMLLGESPIWRAETRTLFITDIPEKRVYKYDWQTGSIAEITVPQETGALILNRAGNLIGCMQDGVYHIFEDETPAEPLFAPLPLAGTRFNDAKAGPDGRIYAGTVGANFSGAFYSIDSKGNLKTLLTGIGCSNGLDWDAERGLLYYIDTSRRALFRFRWHSERDVLAEKQIVREFARDEGFPDGMTMDASGNLWIALWGSGRAICIKPDCGRTICELHLPAKYVSCPAFAGEQLDTLVITTARQDDDHPLAGAVFAAHPEITGRPIWRFDES